MGKKLFDYVIGNPPYQESREGTSDKPVYNYLLDSGYDVGEKAEFITPSRFLFDAGKTPSTWNEKMLHDPHFKVLEYFEDGQTVFPNTEIKGGLAITYRDANRNFGAIEIFTKYEELNSILHKVIEAGISPLSEQIYLQNKFDLDALYHDHPECRDQIGSAGKERRLTTSIFKTLSIFQEQEFAGSVKILGLIDNNRVYRYISRQYLAEHPNLDNYKVILPKVNGTGAFGETLSSPIVGEPGLGFTQSFISIGVFPTQVEAEAALKYLKGRFSRALLDALKVTQDNNTDVWKYVPLQDFTSHSDIDWSQSVHDIDQQLYRKYGLDGKEIEFIETHVQEMA